MAKYLHRADDINCFLLRPMLPLAAIFFFFPSQSELRVESYKRQFDIGFLGFTYFEVVWARMGRRIIPIQRTLWPIKMCKQPKFPKGLRVSLGLL